MKRDIGLLLLRLTTGGLMFLAHGWSKLVNFSHIQTKFPDPLDIGSTATLAIAVFAEVFCALAIAVGFLTRWACIPFVVTMLVAGFVHHWSDPFGLKEKAILYALTAITIFFTGPGRFSVDSFFGIGQKKV